jgi:hypothetical protein
LSARVDIVVPVTTDAALARRTVEFVLAAGASAAFELVVVDAGGTGVDVAAEFGALATAGRVTLPERAAAGSFAAVLDAAFALHPDRDVVVLHAGTEIHGDWLDRLVACGGDDAGAGIVVPFAGAGGVAGYPRNEPDPALIQASANSMDDRFSPISAAGETVALRY